MDLQLFLLPFFFLSLVNAQLRFNFYNSTCPNAESIIKSAVTNRSNTDPSITAALLRMHFHDCFVRGCDASILIDSTTKHKSEKDAGANQSVRGFELIDEVKTALEKECSNIVSCADIVTIATRDAIALSGGPAYAVPTGRRDGRTSNPNEVNLPGPTLSVLQAFSFFQAKGFTLKEMVTLLGAHTVGVAHCLFFRDRLFNFRGTQKPDPSMDPDLVSKLQRQCGRNNLPIATDPTAFLDQNTNSTVDNEFYNQVLKGKGILLIDHNLGADNSTVGFVKQFGGDANGFLQDFKAVMVKMGSLNVLVGNAGEIRKNCRVFNATPKPSKGK
ncbi:peroxidase 44 [Amborella trichopoda]|uniref:Peroxidase n=1 Tax=Amborella trichopoda TaxID=13333 RepID=W1PJK7_AMBTC|nr:peroxidase 44 [Amborella trichopoda]ERN08178.1 hypothetical protein AMTR_s00018p00155980 [Amborella trichopoda]|eukprot:XP_006846503.1 peroxidase 44 [Amborella trichopoda]